MALNSVSKLILRALSLILQVISHSMTRYLKLLLLKVVAVLTASPAAARTPANQDSPREKRASALESTTTFNFLLTSNAKAKTIPKTVLYRIQNYTVSTNKHICCNSIDKTSVKKNQPKKK